MRTRQFAILLGALLITTVSLDSAFAQSPEDVIVTKSIVEGCTGSCSEGDFVNFEIVVNNDVVDEGQNLQVTDLIPPGLQLTSSSPSSGSYDSNTGIWSFFAPIQTQHTLFLATDIKSGTCGQTITNTATLTEWELANSNLNNDQDSASIDVTTLATGAGCEVGGLGVPIDTAALLLASAQSISLWMIPAIAGIGIGVFVLRKRL